MKIENSKRGITLISLVITVIVLLILAAVTLTLTLGHNGIFKIAEKAGENYTKAQEKELGDLASLDERLRQITDGLGAGSGKIETGTNAQEGEENLGAGNGGEVSSQEIEQLKAAIIAQNSVISDLNKTVEEQKTITNAQAETIATQETTIASLRQDLTTTSTNLEKSISSVSTTVGTLTPQLTHEYSTTEKKIGKWTDGKDLYQKTYVTKAPSNPKSASVLCDISDLNYDTIFIANAWVNNGTANLPLMYDGGAGNLVLHTSTHSTTPDTLYFYSSVVKANAPIYITLQYTKK